MSSRFAGAAERADEVRVAVGVIHRLDSAALSVGPLVCCL